MKNFKFLLVLIFFFSPSFAHAGSITLAPDFGAGSSIAITPTGFTFVAQGGDGALTFYDSFGNFLYVSGNADSANVNWFQGTNGHGSGSTSFSTQTYIVSAWKGTYAAGVLVNNNACYGGSFAACQADAAFYAAACYDYNGVTGCSLGGGGVSASSDNTSSSTIDQTEQNLFNGILLFFIAMFIPMWFFTRNR